ncbi:MAG: hypothetical protein WBM44_31595 [Waterburya sp.]
MKFRQLFQSSIVLTAFTSIAILCLTDSQVLSDPLDTRVKDLQTLTAPNISQKIMEGTFDAAESPSTKEVKILSLVSSLPLNSFSISTINLND